MEIQIKRTQPTLGGIFTALSMLSADTVPQVAGDIAVELHKMLIDAPVIEELPVPHLISGDSFYLEFESEMEMVSKTYNGGISISNPNMAWVIDVGPLPLLRYAGDSKWIISTDGFTKTLPTAAWLKQKIATTEQTGVEVQTVTPRDLISIVRNTAGAHALPRRRNLLLHTQFSVLGGQEGASYPFVFCIALGMALCGRGRMEFGPWQPPNIEAIDGHDRLIIKAHPSVPWMPDAPRDDNGPLLSLDQEGNREVERLIQARDMLSRLGFEVGQQEPQIRIRSRIRGRMPS